MATIEPSSSVNKLPAGQVIESLYDYIEDVLDGKVLKFKKGDMFIVIKSTKPEEWVYAVNRDGKLGYVPANFIRVITSLDPQEHLSLLDDILDRLSGTTPATDMITVRQINHARVKLTQLRRDISQKIQSHRTSVSTLNDAIAVMIPEEEVAPIQGLLSSNGNDEKGVQHLQDVNHVEETDKGNSVITSEEKKEVLIEEDKMNGRHSRQGHQEREKEEPDISTEENNKRVDPLLLQQEVEQIEQRRSKSKSEEIPIETEYLENARQDSNKSDDRLKDSSESKTEPNDPKNPTQRRSPSPRTCQYIDDDKTSVITGNDSESITCNRHHHNHQKEKQEDEKDDLEEMVFHLIERVRVCTQLNHDTCKKTIQEVFGCLSESFPSWTPTLKVMARILDEDGAARSMTPTHKSIDSKNLKDIFSRLWSCKNDEQQRSWPVHEDEQHILKALQDLTSILSDANPVLTRRVLSQNNYDHVHMLTAYFQMESRRSLRMELFRVFTQVIRLLNHLIPDYFLTSVLPSCLADEMINYVSDTERWNMSSSLFTLIFSTGHSPPVTLYDHINEKFLSSLLNIIEGFMGDDLDSFNGIQPELSIAPLLAFNLHLTCRERNLVVKTLMNRSKAGKLTENLVSYLNWEEDPTQFPAVFTDNDFKKQMRRPNAVHKLLSDMFESEDTARLFYFNDVKVLIDIIITHLNNLSADAKERLACLVIADKVIKNTSYREEPHKQEQLLKCLSAIQGNEETSLEEKKLAGHVLKSLTEDLESKC